MTDHSATIRDHLTKQRRQASTAAGTCKYRHQAYGRTLMCAVGCLIPDDKYSEGFEGVSIAPVKAFMDEEKRAQRIALGDSLPADLDIEAAGWWQRYHDGSAVIPVDGKEKGFCYVKWCDSDMPDQSPTAFYEALKIHLANAAEPDHGH